MTEPRIRVIKECRHQLERMAEWCDEGACPICQTAGLGMMNDAFERECKDIDKIIIALGMTVDYARTESGRLHIPRIKARIKELKGSNVKLTSGVPQKVRQ